MGVILSEGDILKTADREYKILQLIGRGAISVAYLAECQSGELSSKCILKEYNPLQENDFENGKIRFIRSGRKQNEIRQLTALNNLTPPVSHIFEANGTAYIDIACYNGTTLDRLQNLTLQQITAICLTIAKTVKYYHESGYLCLDLKPENIFILQNHSDDTVTQLVEFIDFDSIRETDKVLSDTVISYTKGWSAPEQLNPYSVRKISKSSDIYTMGEIIFYLVFGRHSNENEHRGFSKYPFEECEKYQIQLVRPDIQSILTKLFRNTIRSSVSNRFQNMDEAVNLLEKLCIELERKDYIIPIFPAVSPYFTGRNAELKAITEKLKENHTLFMNGIGGIGKSTLIRNFISQNKTEYDVIVYLEFEGNFQRTFSDDMQLQISTVSQQNNESAEDYFIRKMGHFKRICGNRKVLFVLDNYSGKITKDLSRLMDCGYDTVIISRNQPPKNSYASMEINAIADISEIYKLITLNLERNMTKEERTCFDEIITLVQGHTLVLELIARQIASERITIQNALKLIRKNGFSQFSNQKIGNLKDGEEVYDTLSAIISALFNAGSMSEQYRTAMKILSLLEVRGLETELFQSLVKECDMEIISKLNQDGWIYADKEIRVHPVIAETVKNWIWSIDDISVMEYHKKMIDIYVGMANHEHIHQILKQAEIYSEQHPRHFIKAMYYDMIGNYYDVLADGAYIPYNQKEADLLEKLIDTTNMAIDEMEQSADSRKTKYLIKYYLSLTSILIRSTPEYYDEIPGLLDDIHELIEENEPEMSENHCYYYMISAWYHTLVEPDFTKTKAFTKKAETVANQVFPTDLEIIDIIHIPAANCYFYHNAFDLAIAELNKAIGHCQKYPDMMPYIDKKAELMNCQLDVYFELQNFPKCRELIAEIDNLNQQYQEQRICREVSPEIRQAVIQ